MTVRVFEENTVPTKGCWDDLDDALNMARAQRRYLVDESSPLFISRVEARNVFLARAVRPAYVDRVFYEEFQDRGPVLKLRIQLVRGLGFWFSFLFTFLLSRSLRKLTSGVQYARVDVLVTYRRDSFETYDMSYVEDLEDVLAMEEDPLEREILALSQEPLERGEHESEPRIFTHVLLPPRPPQEFVEDVEENVILEQISL